MHPESLCRRLRPCVQIAAAAHAREITQHHRILSRGRLRPGPQFRRHRPGGHALRNEGRVPLGPGFRRGLPRLWLRSSSGEPLRADAGRTDGPLLGRFHQRAPAEFLQVALRADRQLRAGVLDGDRRQRALRATRPARSAGADPARGDLCRQRHPVPGHQAIRRAVGAHRLLLRKRDRRCGDPTAPVGLRGGRSRLPRALPRALQRSHPAAARALQRFPRRTGRSALPARPVLRGLAAT